MSAEATYAVRACFSVGWVIGRRRGRKRRKGGSHPRSTIWRTDHFTTGARRRGRCTSSFALFNVSRPPPHSCVSSENRSHLSPFENIGKKRNGLRMRTWLRARGWLGARETSVPCTCRVHVCLGLRLKSKHPGVQGVRDNRRSRYL